ncbi:HxlR family transcriptional regulator [Mucilaginibacter pedocola]|uniref:HxlR family transcriptional regulator n=2 Tax=Mucilaginibacter pedocola TaxID=1792845 RepID=A0A1S9PC94_9SPHI|nr:HxlR family transcriptional regulator [Mucilaginibacter pedocola]
MYVKKTTPSLNCGLDLACEVLYGKWKFRILWFIHQGNIRSSELQRKMPDASSRVIHIQLKELEEHELVARTIYPVMPPKVEYTLTDFGRTLIPVLSIAGKWAEEHQEQLTEAILRDHIGSSSTSSI